MNGYEKGKIYRIIGEGVYYGSTIQKINRRLVNHKSKYNQYLQDNSQQYCSSFEVLKHGNYKIELVEDYPCSSRIELELKEKYYITNFECVNKNIPTRTDKEYREDNKAKILEKKKKYREDNKEVIKKYFELNKEAIKKQKKKYYEENKEAFKKRQKAYHSKKIKDIN